MADNPVLIEPAWPAPDHVKLISTTRIGGCSRPPYDSFNLAIHTNDDQDSVSKNRKKLRQHFHLPSDPVWLNQVHGNDVLSLDDRVSDDSDEFIVDASWTKQNNRVCAVLTADCLPVFITDTSGSVVALAHAGWKGLLAGIITKTVKALNIDSRSLLIWLGPAIGPDAFVVKREVLDVFSKKGSFYESAFDSAGDGLWHCNLYRLVKIELSKLGVKHVYGGGLCTYTDEKRFYSHRRDGEKTGRQAHCIWLDNP